MGDTLVHVTKWDPDFKMKTIHYPPRIIVIMDEPRRPPFSRSQHIFEKKDLKCAKKDWVPLYYSGWTTASIHGREPTTERHGGFDLLRFRPGPIHPSLDDLVVPGSPRSTISIPNLARTPDRHSPLQLRTPELKRSASLSLPVAWITGARHCARREKTGPVGDMSLRKHDVIQSSYRLWCHLGEIGGSYEPLKSFTTMQSVVISVSNTWCLSRTGYMVN